MWPCPVKEFLNEDTIASIERLKQIPATSWLTGHQAGLFEENPTNPWDQYLAVIGQREGRLIDYLVEPHTLEEIVHQRIVYRHPGEPQDFYAMTEEMIMQKHLNLLIARSMVVREAGRFRRV